MQMFSIPEIHSNIIIIASTALSILFLLLLCRLILSWVYKICREFKQLPNSSKATVSVEFLLVIPILLCLILSIFALAEISHAQIVFRYAAFCAARSGVVANGDIKFKIPKFEINLSANTIENMKKAAAIALSSLNTQHIESPSSNLKVKDISKVYYKIGNNIEQKKFETKLNNKKISITPWKNAKLIEDNIGRAYSALTVKFTGTNDAEDKILPINLKIEKMEYKFPLRSGSLFWFIAKNTKGAYPHITLKRTCNVKEVEEYSMLSTGQNFDIPRADNFIKLITALAKGSSSVSIIPGDSTRKDIEEE